MTDENKPWYHGVKWRWASFFDGPKMGLENDDEAFFRARCDECGPYLDFDFPHGEVAKALIIAAPETAQQRDELFYDHANLQAHLYEIAANFNSGPEVIDIIPEIRNLHEEKRELLEALKGVEEWWLSQGMQLIGNGAPHCIFAARAIIAKCEGVS